MRTRMRFVRSNCLALFAVLFLLVALCPRAAMARYEYNTPDPEMYSRFSSGYPNTPVPNTSPRFVGLGYDWSGVGWNADDHGHNSALLSPRHFFTIDHWKGGNGKALRFFGNNGALYTTPAIPPSQLFGLADRKKNEFTLGVIPSPIPPPAQVTYYPLPDFDPYEPDPADPSKVNPQAVQRYMNQPLLEYGSPATIARSSIIYVTSHVYALENIDGYSVSGDSGSPTFIPMNLFGKKYLTATGSRWYGQGDGAIVHADVMTNANKLMVKTGYCLRFIANPRTTWTGGMGSSDFTLDGNWTNGAPFDRDVIAFNPDSANGQYTAVMYDDMMLRGIYFAPGTTSHTGFTLESNGNTLNLGLSGITNFDSGTQTINVPIYIERPAALKSDTGKLVMNKEITLKANDADNPNLLMVDGSGEVTINSKISGAVPLAKEGSGALWLNNPNNAYTGPTYVHNGTLMLGKLGVIPGMLEMDPYTNFGGSGTYPRALTLPVGGRLIPKDTLTIHDLSLRDDSVIDIDITENGNSKISCDTVHFLGENCTLTLKLHTRLDVLRPDKKYVIMSAKQYDALKLYRWTVDVTDTGGAKYMAYDLTLDENNNVVLSGLEKNISKIETNVAEMIVPYGQSGTFGVRLAEPIVSDQVVTITKAAGSANLFFMTPTTLTFTPSNWDVYQPISFTVLTSDDLARRTALIECVGTGEKTSVAVEVPRLNRDPRANPDAFTVLEDSRDNVLDLLQNDSNQLDTDEHLVVSQVTLPMNGTIKLLDGVVTYSPAPLFTGEDTFEYTISDGYGGSSTATVTITVTHVNHNPLAVNDATTVDMDSVGNIIPVLLNDTYAPDHPGPLTVFSVTFPTPHGTATVAPDGQSVLYTPMPLYYGTDSFTYTITDGNGGFSTAFITVTVRPINHPPTVGNDAFFVTANSVDNVLYPLANDTFAPDIDEALTIVDLGPALYGTLTNNGTSITYTPNKDYIGVETITYTISDGKGGDESTATGVIIIWIDGTTTGHLPCAVDDEITVDGDSARTEIGVLDNDTTGMDVGETLTVVNVGIAAHGNAELIDGKVYYTPNIYFSGIDTFTYTIFDGVDGTATATVVVTVAAVNHAPVANPDTLTVYADSVHNNVQVLANDTASPDNNPLFLDRIERLPAHGSVEIVDGSRIWYTPFPNYAGIDTFTYQISDGKGGVAVGLVTVIVKALNHNPTAVADAAEVNEDSTGTVIDVLANDSTTPDPGETLIITEVGLAVHGTTAVVGNKIVYTPTPLYYGTDHFTYTISDGNGGTATATVSVIVRHINHQPTAGDDVMTVLEDSVDNTLDVVGRVCGDIDGSDTLTLIQVGTPAHGIATIMGNLASYTPAEDYFGPDSFTFTVSDGTGGTVSGTVTVTVKPVNDIPSFTPGVDFRVNVDGSSYSTVWATNISTGPENESAQTVQFTVTNDHPEMFTEQPAIAPDGTLTFTTRSTGANVVTITVKMTDDGGTDNNGLDTTLPVTCKITLNGIPVLGYGSAVTSLGVTKQIKLPAATDADKGTLTYRIVSAPQDGVLVLLDPSTGACSYAAPTTLSPMPMPNMPTTEVIVYEVNDGQGGTTQGTMTIAVYPRLTSASIVINENLSAPSYVGAPISLTATAVGGGELEYKFVATYWDGRTTTTEVLQDYVQGSAGRYLTWMPNKPVYNYTVTVYVREIGSAGGATVTGVLPSSALATLYNARVRNMANYWQLRRYWY